MISGDFLLRSGEILKIGSLPTKSGELTGMRHIRKDVLTRRIIASYLRTAVGGQQYEKNRENYKRELCMNVVIIPFSIIACCLVVTWCFKNAFWVNRNGGTGSC